jgi:hypothetical protein
MKPVSIGLSEILSSTALNRKRHWFGPAKLDLVEDAAIADRLARPPQATSLAIIGS